MSKRAYQVGAFCRPSAPGMNLSNAMVKDMADMPPMAWAKKRSGMMGWEVTSRMSGAFP